MNESCKSSVIGENDLGVLEQAPLAKHLKRMQERFPHEYNFFPQVSEYSQA